MEASPARPTSDSHGLSALSASHTVVGHDYDHAAISHTTSPAHSSAMPSQRPSPPRPKKRIVVCCDGTWNDSISTDNPMTNVAKISRCIKSVADDDCVQIVYYASGIGTRTRGIDSVRDGATGRGISTYRPMSDHELTEVSHRYWH